MSLSNDQYRGILCAIQAHAETVAEATLLASKIVTDESKQWAADTAGKIVQKHFDVGGWAE